MQETAGSILEVRRSKTQVEHQLASILVCRIPMDLRPGGLHSWDIKMNMAGTRVAEAFKGMAR